jgi:hypothetical protein
MRVPSDPIPSSPESSQSQGGKEQYGSLWYDAQDAFLEGQREVEPTPAGADVGPERRVRLTSVRHD